MFAPDLPGHGENHDFQGQLTTNYCIDYISRLFTELSLDRTALMGISLGGAIALGFALRWPEKVNRLVLVSSYGLVERLPYHRFLFAISRFPACVHRAVRLGISRSTAAVRLALRPIVHDPASLSDELVCEITRRLRAPGAGKAFLSWQRQEINRHGLRTDYTDRLHEINTRTLLIHGRMDRLIPVECAQRANDLIRNSRLRVFTECGHWPPHEKTDEFNRIVLNFLSE